MAQLNETLRHAVNFIEKHNPGAERFAELKRLVPEFSVDSDSVAKRTKNLVILKPVWGAVSMISMILLVICFFLGIGLLLSTSMTENSEAASMEVLPIFTIVGLCVFPTFAAIAEHHVSLGRNMAVFGKLLGGTEGCIELLNLKKESEQISNYIREVTHHRELSTYDLALCKALAQAEKNAAQQEILKEEIRLACAQLHGA